MYVKFICHCTYQDIYIYIYLLYLPGCIYIYIYIYIYLVKYSDTFDTRKGTAKFQAMTGYEGPEAEL